MIRHRRPRDSSLQSFFEIGVEKMLSPLENFIHKQTTAAILLACATLLALVVSNSPMDGLIKTAIATEMGFVFHHWHFHLSFKEWVSSGLMSLFFFLIGLELKREMLAGRLRHPQQVSLIMMAALGGMIFPALVYWMFNHGTAGAHGWAIPMATDTAFAIGVLALLAKRVSFGVSIFLIAMAIFDDVGAIAIISIFYAHELDMWALLSAVVTLAVLFLVNTAGVRNGWVYAVLGIILWVFIFHSGVHATLAGLLLAVTVPARTQLGQTGFLDEVRELLLIFEKKEGEKNEQDRAKGMLGSTGQHELGTEIEDAVRAASTPLQRWETFLVNPIGIVVLPLFALCTAGVSLAGDEISQALSSNVALGVIAGLVIGKPLGIALMTWIGLRLKLGQLPEGMTFKEVIGAGMLGGIGFTMSLFITTIGFEGQPDMIDAAKTGILFGSLVSAIAASIWLYMGSSQRAGEPES